MYTIIPGGKTAVSPTSLTILNDVPAMDRGIPTASNMGADVTVSIITNHQYNVLYTAATAPATVPTNQSFTTYLAPSGAAILTRQTSSLGDATVTSSSSFTSIYPIPAGFTYQSSSLIGGDARTAGVATITYCTTTGTGCSAKLTGNYTGTTLPYLQVTLPAAVTVPGGALVTMPAVAVTLKATGSVGTVGHLALSEYINVTKVNAPVIGNTTATFDAYPTTGSNTNVTPPKVAPTWLSSTAITS